MAYLDVTPVMEAMRERPEEFELQGNHTIVHMPSRHAFLMMGTNIRVHADCDCSVLQVAREQSQEFVAAVAGWKVTYWEPHLALIRHEYMAARINARFAAHFKPPGLFRRLMTRLAYRVGVMDMAEAELNGVNVKPRQAQRDTVRAE